MSNIWKISQKGSTVPPRGLPQGFRGGPERRSPRFLPQNIHKKLSKIVKNHKNQLKGINSTPTRPAPASPDGGVRGAEPPWEHYPREYTKIYKKTTKIAKNHKNQFLHYRSARNFMINSNLETKILSYIEKPWFLMKKIIKNRGKMRGLRAP